MLKQLAFVALTFSAAGTASAASEDAWAEFTAEVEAGCLAATASILTDATVTVDPFGSESYGLAIVSGTVTGGATSSIICVFDKQTKAIQIGGELAVSVSPVPVAP